MNILDIAIASISFLTFREKILLQKNIDTLDRLVILSIEELSSIIGRSVKSPWQAQSIAKLAEFSLKIIETKGIQAVRYDDEDFPPLLREIFDPPYMIFYRGNLNALQKKCISIVGTRKVCEEAAKSTLDFAKEAALDNRLIISGLANGIDSFAHRGALSSCVGASTAAVLPCGIDTIVPTANKKLADHILRDNGCFLSEYIPGTPAEKWRFVQRNRLIAALSPAVLVCQAPAGSGALITADFALEYNRDVFFHKACFCSEACKYEMVAREKLLSMGASGKKKLDRSPENWVKDGAPVIENYKEYLKVCSQAPGTYSVKKQIELF